MSIGRGAGPNGWGRAGNFGFTAGEHDGVQDAGRMVLDVAENAVRGIQTQRGGQAPPPKEGAQSYPSAAGPGTKKADPYQDPPEQGKGPSKWVIGGLGLLVVLFLGSRI
jgi:hypothetical protein